MQTVPAAAVSFAANGNDLFPTRSDGEPRGLTELDILLCICITRVVANRAATGQATILQVSDAGQVVETYIPPHAIITSRWDYARFVPPLENGLEDLFKEITSSVSRVAGDSLYLPVNLPMLVETVGPMLSGDTGQPEG